ncbi:MAG: hypothetical protein LLG37_04450 [Spirochaetia bacterium]|nr:hypothetical protein [Spirochaetia bacterium]
MILTNRSYGLNHGPVEPARLMAKMLFNGGTSAYHEAGKHSTEHGLCGIYRIFVKAASQQFIPAKAGDIPPAYYNPGAMRGGIADRNKFHVFITQS